MAKRKHTSDTSEQAPAPVPPRKANRQGVPVNCWLRPDLGAAFMAYVNGLRPRPTVTSAVELAIEEFLISRGLYQPPAAD